MQTPKVRNYLKRMVLRQIDLLFDQSIHEKEQNKRPKPAEINAQVRTSVKSLLKLLKDDDNSVSG